MSNVFSLAAEVYDLVEKSYDESDEGMSYDEACDELDIVGSLREAVLDCIENDMRLI